jgi:hypothetical protein
MIKFYRINPFDIDEHTRRKNQENPGEPFKSGLIIKIYNLLNHEFEFNQ